MKRATVVGLALILLGASGLVYQRITYTTHERVLDLGPVTVTRQVMNTIALPGIMGGAALFVGCALLLMLSPKKVRRS